VVPSTTSTPAAANLSEVVVEVAQSPEPTHLPARALSVDELAERFHRRAVELGFRKSAD